MHIPYKGGGPALVDLMAGRVPVMVSTLPSAVPQIKAGKVRAHAVTSSKRSSAVPELPTVAELGMKGFETSVWFGIVAPNGTPEDIVAKLNSATHAVLDLPEVQEQLRAQGIEAVKSTRDEFVRHIRSEWLKPAPISLSVGARQKEGTGPCVNKRSPRLS